MTKEDAKKLWVKNVYNKSNEIDPDNQHDWYDLAIGFFLALGFSYEEAINIYYNELVNEGTY